MTQQLLLIEDDDTLRSQLARMLRQRGMQVNEAASVPQCLDLLPDLACQDKAILDLNLGDDNGLSLIEPLLRHSPECRILVLTGYASIPTAVAATRLGAHQYLPKPASLEQILGALDTATEVALPELPDTPPSLERLEWEHIQRVLDEHNGNISAAARILGIHRRTLQRRLKKRPSAAEYDRDR